MASLEQTLATAAQVSVIVFSASSMLGVGLASPLSVLIEPLRKPRGVLIALLANFVVVPALGFTLVHTLGLERHVAVGLLLMAMAAGAPFLLTLTMTARGDVTLSASLLVLLLPATILYLPLALPILVPEARVSAWAIAQPLLLTMLLPLGVGVIARSLSRGRIQGAHPWLKRLTSAALIIVIASSLAANLGRIRLLRANTLSAAVLLILGAFVAGYTLSTRGPEGRTVLGLGTAQRNVAAAMVVATQAVRDPMTTLMVVVASMIELGILFPLAWWLRRKTNGREREWQRRARRTS